MGGLSSPATRGLCQMRATTRRGVYAFIGAAVALLTCAWLIAPALGAQAPPRGSAGTIAGRVTDSTTSRPVASAQVTVEGTRLGNVTDDSGRYAITGVPSGQQRVQVRRIGYGPRTSAARSSATRLAWSAPTRCCVKRR